MRYVWLPFPWFLLDELLRKESGSAPQKRAMLEVKIAFFAYSNQTNQHNNWLIKVRGKQGNNMFILNNFRIEQMVIGAQPICPFNGMFFISLR
ncbi:hypothetical protein A1OO_19355 [Enterovibrio norvegicus FF-33]|uniref:Uncharacterized protein n=1 Tax=Enterovibrio norvegicus FF-454 TaxID=1185651 RepID=A0A1E5C0E7_9GAMM|nr:hypothetical protein A1OK_02785 [Enterovibrio norvegicus FF-454]OEE67896.1 hypothetical protein A1OO_19355 [Enterovibrio norvegicus FF-33]OEE73973.1 hypothetical protein A1OQ_10175 [Enterovibrio norvegicus FF-162]